MLSAETISRVVRQIEAEPVLSNTDDCIGPFLNHSDFGLMDMDNVDMLTLVIQEMSKAFPTLIDTLLNERDMYMSSTLLNVAREHSSVVAVVGKGHLAGIKKNWKQPIEMKHLLEIPTRSAGPSRTTILVSVGVAFTGIAAAIYLLSKR